MNPTRPLPKGNHRLKNPAAPKWRAQSSTAKNDKQNQLQLLGNQKIQFEYKDSFEPVKTIASMERAVKKSISFRVFATMGTFAVAWVFTGNPFTSVGLASAQAITNTTIYYFHEKHWETKVKPATNTIEKVAQ